MADNTGSRWIRAFISGLGEAAFWADPDEMESAASGGMAAEVESLTQIMIAPQGMAFRPVAQKMILLGHHVAAIGLADAALVEHLTKAWDKSASNGGIVLPSEDARRKLGLR